MLSMRYTHVLLVAWLGLNGTIGGGADPLLDEINETTLPEINDAARRR